MKTSFDGLYAAIGAVLLGATGRSWWQKGRIQAQPSSTYATVWLSAGDGLQNPVTENVYVDPATETEVFRQVPWGTMLVDCQVDFYRKSPNDSSLQAATRFANSLRLTEREFDLWLICGLSGGTRVIDISGMFRADVEDRARVTFRVYANIADPEVLAGDKINEISEQPLTVTKVSGAAVASTTIENPGETIS